MPAIDSRLILVLLWIIGCAGVEFWIFQRRNTLPLPGIAWTVAAAFAVRFIPALILPRGARYEMNVFEQAGAMLLTHQNVYHAPIAHPYLPLQLYVFAAAEWLTNSVGGAFPFWAKLPNIFADTAMTGVVFLAVRKLRTTPDAHFASWLYVFNPVVILVVAYQGQYDAIPVLLMIGAWYIFTFHGARRGGLLGSALVLGLGVLSKTYPVILMPILLLRLKKPVQWLTVILAVTAVPLLALLLYEWFFPGSLTPIGMRAIRAGSIPGWWGYSALLNVIVELTGYGADAYAQIVQAGRYVSLAAAVVIIFWSRRLSVLSSLLLTVLTLFTFMPNLGLQGLSWLIPIGLLLGSVEVKGYTLGVLIYMIIAYWGIHLTDGLYLLLPALYASVIIQLSSLTAWGAVVWWWWRAVQANLLNAKFSEPRLID